MIDDEKLLAAQDGINKLKARNRTLHLQEIELAMKIKECILEQTVNSSNIIFAERELERLKEAAKEAERPSFFHRHFGR